MEDVREERVRRGVLARREAAVAVASALVDRAEILHRLRKAGA